MSVIRDLPSFQNVGAGLTAVLPNIPMGDTYEQIVFELGGTSFTKAHIEEIRVYLGGKAIVQMTGTQLDTINQYMGLAENAAYLTLNFSEPSARTIVGETLGGLDTSLGYAGFHIELDIASGASAPTLKGFAKVSPPQEGQAKGLFRAFTKVTESFSAAGEYNMRVGMGSQYGNLLKRVYFIHEGDMTQLEVTKNGLYLLKQGTVARVNFLANELNRESQTNMLVFDPTLSDNQSDAVTTLDIKGNPAAFEFKVTTSDADQVIAIAELYTTLTRL